MNPFQFLGPCYQPEAVGSSDDWDLFGGDLLNPFDRSSSTPNTTTDGFPEFGFSG